GRSKTGWRNGSEASEHSIRWFCDGEEVLFAADDEQLAGHRRCRQHGFAERISREQLILRAGFDDKQVTIFARDVQLPSGRDWRRGKGDAAFDALLIEAISSLRLVSR